MHSIHTASSPSSLPATAAPAAPLAPPVVEVGPAYLLPDFVRPVERLDTAVGEIQLTRWGPRTPAHGGGLSREELLAHYAAVLGYLLHTYAQESEVELTCAWSAAGTPRRHVARLDFATAGRPRAQLSEVKAGLGRELTSAIASEAPVLDDAIPGVECHLLSEGELAGVERLHPDLIQLLIVQEAGEPHRLYLRYPRETFRPRSLERLLQRCDLLASWLEAEAAEQADRPLLHTEGELDQIRAWSQGRTYEFPREQTLGELVGRNAARFPQKPAIRTDAGSVSYAELEARTNRLARALQARGIGRHAVVALVMPRSATVMEAALAVVKAGAAYLPINPREPAARLRHMLESSDTALMLTASEQPPTVGTALPAVSWAELEREAEAQPETPLDGEFAATDLAYIMFTSGSTGMPKGVEIDHRAICRCVRGDRYSSLRPEHTCLIASTTTFDPFTYELWASFANGATAVVLPDGVPDGGRLGDYIRRFGVTHAFLPTALFHGIMEEPPPEFGQLQQLLTGGEAMTRKAAFRFLDEFPDTLVLNGYGPTENTVFSTYFPVTRDTDRRLRTIPIGKPCDNSTVFVLDEHGQLAPVGVAGMLWVGGDGVAQGYRKQPELNAERFRTFPHLAEFGRLYRTGDRVRWTETGDLEFLGREDFQVKVRGFRIELPEIEQALDQHPAVMRSLVTVTAKGGTDKRLVAYVELGEAFGTVTAEEVLRGLEEQLPYYMIPSVLIPLEAMPLTNNGKIDRRALPEPNLTTTPTSRVPPRNETEQLLLEIWQRVLPNAPRGIDDDFLVLGGDSIRCIRLLAAIERGFNKRISYQSLLAAPTIRKLAALLERSGQGENNLIVPLRQREASPDAPPVLFTHGHGYHSGIYTFRVLLPYLDPKMEVYGLQGLGMDGDAIPAERLEQLVARYVDEIERTFEGRAPILVCYCGGAAIAYEIYRQLTRRGMRPPALIGIEAITRANEKIFLRRRNRALRRRILEQEGFLPLRILRSQLRGVPKKARDILSYHLGRCYLRVGRQVPPRMREGYILEKHFRLFQRYGFPEIEADFHLIRCARSYLDEPDYGWGRHIRGSLEITQVDMPHNMLFSEHAATLADPLNRIIARYAYPAEEQDSTPAPVRRAS